MVPVSYTHLETAKNFLEVGNSGFITKLYGTETSVCGFYVNAGYPNDGTKAPSGPGYNGTTVVNTKLKDGDVVDFFFYADGDAYSDYYTWIDVPETMVTGEAITVTVKGFYAVEGYRYKDAAELKAAAPVSYTHLDVYKRQGLLGPHLRHPGGGGYPPGSVPPYAGAGL